MYDFERKKQLLEVLKKICLNGKILIRVVVKKENISV